MFDAHFVVEALVKGEATAPSFCHAELCEVSHAVRDASKKGVQAGPVFVVGPGGYEGESRAMQTFVQGGGFGTVWTGTDWGPGHHSI